MSFDPSWMYHGPGPGPAEDQQERISSDCDNSTTTKWIIMDMPFVKWFTRNTDASPSFRQQYGFYPCLHISLFPTLSFSKPEKCQPFTVKGALV